MKKNKGAKFYKKPIVVVGKSEVKKLKIWAAKNPKKRYRICLHNNQSHLTQEMLICTKGYSYIRPHKHPKNVSESYHVLEGALRIYILNDESKILKVINLSSPSEKNYKFKNFMYRVSSPLYHLTVPLTKWTVYHEVTTGPFLKNKMVKYANFSPDEDEEPAKINKFLSKLGIKQKLLKRQI